MENKWVESLSFEPFAAEDDLYRIREGDYRIIYTVRDKQLIVPVVKVGDRKDVHR